MSDPSDQLISLQGEATPAASPEIGRLFTRREDGVICYPGTPIPIPGGSTITAGDAADIKVLARRDGTPLAAVISRAEIEAFDGLSWVLEIGEPLRREPVEEYEVPWPIWQERSGEAIGVRAPEWDGTGLPKMLALQERKLRFMRWELEQETERRARTIAVAARLGEARRDIGKTLGISKVRINQIIDDLSPLQLAEVDRIVGEIVAVLRFLGAEARPSDDVAQTLDCSDELLAEMAEMGLIDQDDELRLKATKAGEQAELHLRAFMQKGD
jgi:hypothetical protein